MPHLSIKNVPEAVVAKLRERATRNHRSLQGELMALVCKAAEDASSKDTDARARSGKTGTKRIEQIAAEHRSRWKEPFTQGPSAVDMIRADRDAR